MPISGGVDFAAISAEMGSVVNNWFNGMVRIIDPNLENIQWDEWTNTSTGSEIVLWEGKARIQPIRSASSGIEQTGFAVSSIRTVRFQVPLDETRDYVRAGLQVKVIDGGMFPDLTELSYVILSAFNSSYAWLTTIECEVDAKS